MGFARAWGEENETDFSSVSKAIAWETDIGNWCPQDAEVVEGEGGGVVCIGTLERRQVIAELVGPKGTVWSVELKDLVSPAVVARMRSPFIVSYWVTEGGTHLFVDVLDAGMHRIRVADGDVAKADKATVLMSRPRGVRGFLAAVRHVFASEGEATARVYADSIRGDQLSRAIAGVYVRFLVTARDSTPLSLESELEAIAVAARDPRAPGVVAAVTELLAAMGYVPDVAGRLLAELDEGPAHAMCVALIRLGHKGEDLVRLWARADVRPHRRREVARVALMDVERERAAASGAPSRSGGAGQSPERNTPAEK